MPAPGRCDHCAEPTAPAERYCRNCGAVLSAETPSAETPLPSGAFLLIHLPGGIVRKEPLRAAVTRIGRGKECDIVVDDPRVSRLHAVIEVRAGEHYVGDARSSGGTFLNETPVHGPVLLRAGDTCRLGRVPEQAVTLVYHEKE